MAGTVAIGYYVLSRLGLAFVEPTNQVAVTWLASGFALAALMVVERRLWPVVVAAVLAGNLVAELQVRGATWVSIAIALVNAVAPLLAAWSVAIGDGRRGDVTRPMPTHTPTRVLAGLGVALLLGNTVSSAIGAAIVHLEFGVPFLSAWSTWWFGDGLGYLMVAPIAVAFAQRRMRPSNPFEQTLMAVSATSLAVVVFHPDLMDGGPEIRYPFLLFPVLLWSAQRGGLRLTTVLLATVGIITSLGVARGQSPFSQGPTGSTTDLLGFQIYLAAMIVCTMLVASTATEAAQNERSAREEQERVASILRAATEYAIIGTGADGRITFFSEGAERLLGYRAEEVIGRHAGRTLHVASEIATRAGELGVIDSDLAFTWSARQGVPETRPWTYRRKNGSHVTVMLTISPERDLDGKLIGFIGVARDLSDQERTEQEIRDSLLRERAMVERLRASNEMRSEFVSNVSHELRTPLTNVLGYTEMLLAGDFGDISLAQRRALATVAGNGHRLLDLVQDLLTLNRMDAGRFDIERADTDLTVVVETAVETVSLAAERSDIVIDADLQPGVAIAGDRGQLERVLINVIGNAVKFSPQGGRIGVELTCSDVCRITVSDVGVGIDADDLSQVFDRFYRAKSASHQAIPGTGLGLPIAKGIVEAHGGTIELDSQLGVGTTVSITLPAPLPSQVVEGTDVDADRHEPATS